ncbi:peptidoglycan DD-metalloendopeptidase family protein [Bacillus songklensis]|uniref:Peptidoglycan DD-metalloendopeptidase family protein n=1 Tax=Bacillus songklensis TaxID=1069116 RepID=A0ABV8AXQ0_9BACI
MLDFVRRILVVVIMALCIGLLFVGGKMAKAEENGSWQWPVEGKISDVFGSRDAQHHGIDIAAPVGTDVMSVSKGIVSRSYFSDTYGHVIFVQQENGYETVYAHLHKRFVFEGNVVQARQKIGEVGNTGRSSGAHLHFEVHKGSWNNEKSNALNPLLVLDQKRLYAYLDDRYTSKEVFKQTTEVESNHKIEETVQQGDTLWELANKYNTTIGQIKKWNTLKSDSIYIGQTIVIYAATVQSNS